MSNVLVKLEYKMSLGKSTYENLTIGVEIQDDVKPDEKVSDAVDRVHGWVENRLTKYTAAARKDLQVDN